MSPWYTVLKFVHVSAVIVWVGGVVTMAALGGRLVRAGDPASLQLLGRQSNFFGRRVQGPAVGIALLAGLAMMGIMKTMTFWLGWGLVALVASMALDGAVLRKASRELAELSTAQPVDEVRMDAARRRLRTGSLLNILILLSTVWVMVLKP